MDAITAGLEKDWEMIRAAERVRADPHSRDPQVIKAILSLPTLSQTQDADLKLEWRDDAAKSEYRVWVSRMTVEDGARFDHAIILEHRYTDSRSSWGWRQWERASKVAGGVS